MPKIKIYTTPICPYCVRAKALLKKKGASFDEVDVFMDSDARKEMEAKSNGARLLLASEAMKNTPQAPSRLEHRVDYL